MRVLDAFLAISEELEFKILPGKHAIAPEAPSWLMLTCEHSL